MVVRARNASRTAWILTGAVVAVLAVGTLAIAGSGGGDGAARQALARYLTALRHNDAPTACDQLTRSSRAALGQIGSQLLLTGQGSCEDAMKTLLRSGAGPRLRHLASVPVLRVERDGDVARAFLRGRSAPLVVRREGGGWRVAGDDVAAAGMFSS
jgi:hypothetical protein